MGAEKRKSSVDMTNGPIFGKLILFALPIIFSGVLQLFYNAMDMIIVGRFNGKTALAAVGATGALINLLTNSFIGLSLGASVIEKHFCLSRKIQTPDSAFSMEKEEFAEMVKAIRQAERAVVKDVFLASAEHIAAFFQKSAVHRHISGVA